ncbi:MAG: LytTR family DNA-binding domain-containing protein [Myxococcota bacterium]
MLLVDDERLARVGLRRLLAQHGDVEVVGEASSVEEAAVQVETHDPDALFLDVQMLDGTGFDLFHRVRVRGRVIFVTAHPEHALDAFGVGAADYLVKPVSAEKVERALARLRGAPATRRPASPWTLESRLALQESTTVRVCQVKDIACIRASGDFSEVHLRRGVAVLVSQPLRGWEERLPESFVRIHRSTIVNVDVIEAVLTGKTWHVKLTGWSEPLAVSRRHTAELRTHLDAWPVG